MSENCDIIGIFPIYDQFEVILKPNSKRIVCKAYIFINSNLFFFFTRTENRTKKSRTQLSYYSFE